MFCTPNLSEIVYFLSFPSRLSKKLKIVRYKSSKHFGTFCNVIEDVKQYLNRKHIKHVFPNGGDEFTGKFPL